IILQNQGMAWWLRSLHCRLTAKRSWVRFPHGPLLVRGAGPPQTFSVQVGYVSLCGVCMFSQCPQEHQQHTLLSIPDQDGRFTSLGPRALKSCPGGRTIRDGEMQKSKS